ncbi:MAG: SRPBCC domain-containing protein [Chloroflexi bacterium]|nr:SRPBCC domain-containing protein [Chloroflexota bacterium]
MTAEMIARDSIDIEAVPACVWEVLTKPQHTRQYMFGCDAESDWQVGSRLVWRGTQDGKVYVKGTIVQIDRDRLLQYTTFSPDAFDHYEDKPENYTTVTLELTPLEGATRLSVSQGDFAPIANGGLRFAHTVNSWKTTLAQIKEIAERP